MPKMWKIKAWIGHKFGKVFGLALLAGIIFGLYLLRGPIGKVLDLIGMEMPGG